MRGIVLISHGRFAEGIKESLEMLCGECPQVSAVCLGSSDNTDEFAHRLRRAYKKARQYGEPLVFCDVMGGTPCNLALQQLMEECGAALLSGMNLPMLMTAALEEADTERLLKEGKNGIADVLAQMGRQFAECEEE